MIHTLNRLWGFINLKSLLVLLCCLFWSIQSYGQKHHFKVHKGGKEIGEVTATLKKSLNTQIYKIQSDVSFRILWKHYRRKTNSTVTYRDEFVETSYLGIYMNNEMVDSSTVEQDINEYHAFKFPDDHFVLNQVDLRFTTAKLYFQEPLGIKRVYSERFLKYCPLEAQGDSRYKLHLPDNKVNYYIYKDEQLAAVLVERTWFNLEFRKVK